MLSQSFGAETSENEADILTAVKFDESGDYMATGDKGGRIVLFSRFNSPPPSKPHKRDSSSSDTDAQVCTFSFVTNYRWLPCIISYLTNIDDTLATFQTGIKPGQEKVFHGTKLEAVLSISKSRTHIRFPEEREH
jgi:hypothetical protein